MTIKRSIMRFAFVATLGLLLAACTNDYMGFNTNPYEATNPELDRDGYKWRSALMSMQGYVIPTDVNLCQYTECLLGGPFGGYLAESKVNDWDNRFSTYNPSQNWNRVMYVDIIPKILPNMQLLKDATKEVVPLAVAEIVKVAALHRITDVYGPIPYTHLGAEGKLTAPFDSQQEVYAAMFKALDNAISVLTDNRTVSFSPYADKVYDGRVELWVKFANSLKLRLAMRIVYTDYNVDGKTPQILAEEAVNHPIGVITANEENAMLAATTNPFYTVCYEYNGGDSRAAADIVNYMSSYKDPRINNYFTRSTFKDADNGYFGLRVGTGVMSSAETTHAYSNMVVQATTKLLWMNAAEVAFLKAEGALRGWNMKGETAEALYGKGVELSFAQWNTQGAAEYLASEFAPTLYKDPKGTFTYTGLSSAVTVKWKASAGFDEENLERIITQKWIAMFPLGLEAWAEFRRTGYPKFMEVPQNLSNGEISEGRFARRLTYPMEEYKDNAENMPGAIEKLKGADKMSTHVWWDCNPRLTNQ